MGVDFCGKYVVTFGAAVRVASKAAIRWRKILLVQDDILRVFLLVFVVYWYFVMVVIVVAVYYHC